MLHLFLDDRPWFRAKRRGYGTGLPIACNYFRKLMRQLRHISFLK